MPLVTTRSLIDEAVTSNFSVGAFNAICLEHAEAIAWGAEQSSGRAIIQISENAVRYHHGSAAGLVAACRAVAEESSARLSLHLDHVVSEALLHQAADLGVSSVMFDASIDTYERNLERTAAAVTWGHENDLFIESELGEVGGKDGAHAPGVRTDPQQASEFVSATGVDALAVAVGSSHAMVDRSAELDNELITRIAQAVPVPLVLHGSSGVPDDGLRAAVRAGMRKVNIGTALNIGFTTAVRDALGADQKIVDPRKYLGPGRDAMAQVVADALGVLTTA